MLSDKKNDSQNEIDILISLLAKLPGLGRRSARRAVLHMISRREVLMAPISNMLMEVYNTVHQCDICGNITTTSNCLICLDEKRDKTKLCVVSDVSDLWAMERANIFKGRFYVLGGLLSALDGIGPETLKIPFLIERIKSEGIQEVILALSATINGQTTAHYIADQLQTNNVEITSLAHGVPIGGDLDYLDEGTIEVALKGRKTF
ncbi:MAG: recombination protein RecR [Rhodobacteraceae bacterium]|nr:MAG: recombination protein RecR [Paracoccaceae bacterium]|tara:strand:+ start:1659 stop:2273 length:615 start_codon:yes stop_codon:yes gene_type:complete